MKLHSLKLRGLSVAFPREVEVDFRAVGPGVVCIVGGNGAGKSHLLSCSGAATLFREFPDYGESFAAHVIDGCRDAFSELTFELGGHVYRALLQADPLFGGGRGKTEGYLFRDGQPIAGPLVKDFDAAIAQILPSRDMFLATVFAAQGGGGSFFGMPKAARKDMFAQMLGLEHLQQFAERSRDLARTALLDLDRCKADVEAARVRRQNRLSILEEAKAAESDRAASTSEREALGLKLAALRQTYDAAVVELARVKAAADAAERDRVRIANDLAAARADLARLAERKRANESILARETEVARAESELQQLEAKQRSILADIDAEVAHAGALNAELAAATERRNSLATEYRRINQDLAKANAAVAELEAVSERRAKLQANEQRLAGIQAELDRADVEIARLEADADRDAENDRQRDSLRDRIQSNERRTGALQQIDASHPMCTACPLTSDARSAADAVEEATVALAVIPLSTGAAESLRRVRGENTTRRTEISALRQSIESERGALATAEAGRALADRKLDLDAELARNLQDGSAAKKTIDTVTLDHAASELRVSQLRATLAEVEASVASSRAAAAQRAAIDAARDEAPKIAAETETLSDRVQALEQEQRTHAAAPVDVLAYEQALRNAQTDLDAATYAAETVDREVALHGSTLERCNGALAQLGDPDADLERLGRREKGLAEEAGDWALLEKAMGRDGIQALEIDAAGPGVTSLANELLASCYGNRFSLSIETTALKKDGGLKEVFDVRIIDAQNGRDAKQGSGGEMVILDEALRLALAIYQTQQSGFELRTLWRDETAGALSPDNADRYVQMLRRARELGGFEQVLFIAHSPDVWQQADARLFVEAGAVTPDTIAEAA